MIDQLAAKARQYLPPRTTQEDFELREDGNNENFEFSATFPDRIPAEILEAIEGEPHLHMRLRIAKPGERAGGPDALHTLGADRYVQYLRESHQSEVGRIVEGLASSGAADIDPEIKMLLWLEEHRITGRKIPQSTPSNTLVEGDTFTIHGEQFAVRLDEDENESRIAIQAGDSENALVIYLDAVENVPVDRGSLVKAPKAQPPAAPPTPAEPYRSEAISKPTRTDLLGQPVTEPNTGRQAELLTKGREDDAPTSSPDDKIRNRFKDSDTPINPSLARPAAPTVAEKPREQAKPQPEPVAEPTQDGDAWIDDGGAGAGNPHLPPPLRAGARPEERIVTARWEYTPDIDTSVIPAGIAKNLQPHQAQATAAAWTAMHRGSRGFLLASGTGAGKTRSILAVAQMHMQAENRPVVVVAPNEVLGKPASNRGIVSGSYANDAKAMGLDYSLIKSPSDQIRDGHLYYTTYEHAHKLDIPSNAVVVFDEAHALKNAIATQSQRGMRGTKIIDNAHAVLFASATPADKAIHIPYLQRAGVFEGRTQDEQLRYLDMTERIQKDRSGRIVSRTWVPRHDAGEVLQRLDALFARLTLNGQMIKHEINFSGVDVGIQRIRLPREAHRVLDDIARAFPGGGLKQALRLMHQRRQQEPYKVQAVADAVEQAIKAGRRPIVFLARVNYAEAVKRVRDRETGEIVSEEVIAASDATSKLLKDELRRRGITKIAELHGESDTNAAEAMRQFQGDEAEAMIATVQSGGTGVNLDDTVGNRPRTLIMMTPPFSAVDNVQAFGRVWRLSTKSNPQIRVVLGDTETDQWNAGIIAAKMRTLGATVSGESRRMVSEDEDGGVQAFNPQQTASTAFRTWFGNSKVVDASGNPLVVYHGTAHDTTVFDKSKIGQRDDGWYGRGFYFTPDAESASRYAESTSGATTGPNVVPVYLSIQNPYVWPDGRTVPYNADMRRALNKELAQNGYDGVIVPVHGEPGKFHEVVAFSPTQIKSATGNRGTFDGSNPDIRAFNPQPPYPPAFSHSRQAVPIDPNRPQPITPGRVPIKGPISEHQIRMRAERGFGEPIRRDRLRIKALGQHDDRQRTIRLITDRFGDVGAVMHEVAHGIDTDVPKGRPTVIKAAPASVRAELAGLDYDQSKRRPSEGFAEFLRYAITHDDVATRAPVTTAWFQQTFLPAHPKIAKELGVIRAMTNQWRGQTPGQRQEANTATSNTLPVPETRPERVARAFHVALRWADTNLNDKGAPLRRMRDAARKAGYVVTDETDPHALLMFHQLLGSHYSNEAIRGKGVPSVRNPGQILYKPLKDILSQISETDYKDWRNFVIARHSLEVLDAGINPGGTREDHQAVFDEFKGRADFVKAADEFTAWNNAVLEMMAETGAISRSDYNSMVGKWKHYVPLRRAIGGGGTGTRGGFDNPMLARTGGDLPVIDPILTAQQRLLGLYNRATRQIVAEATLNMAEETGTLGGFAERVPPNMERSTLTVGDIRKQLEAAGTPIDESTKAISDGAQLFFFRPSFKTGSGSHIMRFYRNGENQLWEFPEDVYEVFDTAADIGGSGVIDAGLGIIRTAARAKRLGATGVNPARIPVNLTIDTITSWLTTDINNPAEWGARQVQATYRLLLHHIQSAMHSTLGTEAPHGIVDLYNRLGGNIEGRMAVDFAEIAAKRNQMLSNPTRRKALRIVGTPRGIGRIMGGTLGVVRDFVNFTEAIPRLAEMTDHLAAHGHTEATIKAGTPVPRNVLVGGFNKASDLTLNYRRGGTWARQANQYVPFLNSAIRSYEKLGRTVKEHPYRTALRLSPMIAMTVILWALRKDDDEYQEEPDWLKYGYWNFTDSDGRIVVRIPRAHEWGWLFTSSIEAALNAIYEKDPDLIGQYLEALAQKMTPNIMPAGVQEVMEVGFNQDFFRQNEIVDQNMARFLARDQTRPESTIVARQLGRLMGWSPAKVDHFVNGLTGGSFERYTNFLSTFELGPFVGSGVTVKNDYLRTIGEFHDEATRAEQRFNSSRLLPGGDTSELGPGDQALGDRNHAMSWYAGVMTDLRKLVPPDATRDERYAVNRYIAGLARHAMGKEELEQFPNPFHVRDLPPEVAAVIRKEREGLQRSARINAQTARSREQVRRARMMLRSLASPDPAR